MNRACTSRHIANRPTRGPLRALAMRAEGRRCQPESARLCTTRGMIPRSRDGAAISARMISTRVQITAIRPAHRSSHARSAAARTAGGRCCRVSYRHPLTGLGPPTCSSSCPPQALSDTPRLRRGPAPRRAAASPTAGRTARSASRRSPELIGSSDSQTAITVPVRSTSTQTDGVSDAVR